MKKIIKKEKFNSKQFEYICLTAFESFMRVFLREDNFQVRLYDNDSVNGLVFEKNNTFYSVIYWGTILKTFELALKLTENRKFFEDCCNNLDYKVLSKLNSGKDTEENYYKKKFYVGTDDTKRQELAFWKRLIQMKK